MSEIGARLVKNGQVALICGAVRLARMDGETEEHARLMAELLSLIAHIAFAPAVVNGARLSQLRFKLAGYAAAIEGLRRDATGEIDWLPAYRAQAEFRLAADDCLDLLYARSRTIWGRAGAAGAAA